MNISRFFIDRPVFAGVLSVLIVVAGLIGLRSLPISEYPEVVPPSIVVRATYPGANPSVIAETVATPLEEQINGVEGMETANALSLTLPLTAAVHAEFGEFVANGNGEKDHSGLLLHLEEKNALPGGKR